MHGRDSLVTLLFDFRSAKSKVKVTQCDGDQCVISSSVLSLILLIIIVSRSRHSASSGLGDVNSVWFDRPWSSDGRNQIAIDLLEIWGDSTRNWLADSVTGRGIVSAGGYTVSPKRPTFICQL